MALVTGVTTNNLSDLGTTVTTKKRPRDQVSRLTPKKPSDLLPSAIISALETESVTVETHTEDGSDEQPLLNSDSYSFSNFATATILEMLSNGTTSPDKGTNFLPHFEGLTTTQIHEQYPLVHALSQAAGFAGGPSIRLDNRYWIQRSETLKSDIDDVFKRVYHSDISYISYFIKISKSPDLVKSEMNTWLKEKTRGAIQDTFGSHTVDPTTRLLTTASIDFEGQWSVPFRSAGCRTFTLPSGDVIRTQYMTSSAPQYLKKYSHFTVLSIPFKQHPATEYKMLFYLPDETTDFLDLQSFIGLHEDVILEEEEPTEQVPVSNFLIPKFTIKMRGNLPLDPSVYYLDTLLENNSGVSLGKILCNTYLHVSEKGLRAAGSSTAYVNEFTPDVEDTSTLATATQSGSSSSPAPTTATTPPPANATPTTTTTTTTTTAATATPTPTPTTPAAAATTPTPTTPAAATTTTTTTTTPAAAATPTKPTITTSKTAIASFPSANSTTTTQTPPRKKARFMANRPFLFYVRDSKYGRLLFCGGITNPMGTSFS